MDRIKEQSLLHLFILLVGVGIAAFFFILFGGNFGAQIIIAAIGCIYYVSWGIMHHIAHERVDRLIILEYILIGLLVFFLILFALTV